jgi:hypothetical protein
MRFDRKKNQTKKFLKIKNIQYTNNTKPNQSPKSRKNLSFYHSSESGKKRERRVRTEEKKGKKNRKKKTYWFV